MARLRNVPTGAIVSVRDEKVERLGSEWVPVETEVAPAPKVARTPKAAVKSAAPTK